MKKLIVVSSLLALVLAGSGLFALDIPVGDGGGKFVLDMQAEYEFDIIFDASKDHDNDKAWIQELDADKQGKISVAASYDGDNYAFGVGFGARKAFILDSSPDFYLDNAWGKFYLLDKQLWLRGGSMDGLWRIDTDPLNKNYGGDNGPGLQINFAPSVLKGLNVGVALPVPKAGTRVIKAAVDANWTGLPSNYTAAVPADMGDWGPTYPLVNAAFGLRLNGTIPNLDIGTELDLLGNKDNNGKTKTDADEKEGDFKGMRFHLTAVYTFAPVTLKAAIVAEGIANNARNSTTDAPQLTSVGARLIFDIPNAEGYSLDLGDPWVQFQMLPSNRNGGTDGDAPTVNSESFKDMLIDFEWEPSYSLVPDRIKALLWFGVSYATWDGLPVGASTTVAQKDHQVTFAVRPGIEFKFAPNATLKFQDKVFFLRQKTKEGLRNELGFRFAWAF
ncbi:MAG: hypothetical protein LBJ41_07235 [Treponema sp.]|jgi:hypothetical protein|nr:hypothetical protein [Treponema sp.]